MYDVARSIAIGLMASALMCAATAGAENDSDPLGVFAALVGGTWVYEGVNRQGNPVVDRQVYEWMWDQRFVKVNQANRSRDSAHITEAILGWDSERGSLQFWHFANSGKISRGVVSVDEGVFVWEAEILDAEILAWRATIELLDEDQTRQTLEYKK